MLPSEHAEAAPASGRGVCEVMLRGEQIRSFELVGGSLPVCEFSARFVRCEEQSEVQRVCENDPSMIAVRAPAWVAIGCGRQAMLAAAKMHGVKPGRAGRNEAALPALLQNHTCGPPCGHAVSLLTVSLVETAARGGGGAANPSEAFPPAPPTVRQKAAMVRAFTEACKPGNVYESPCAVCGSLTFLHSLGRYDAGSLDLRCLERPGEGVTRIERHSREEPVQELAGPILYQGGVVENGGRPLLDICNLCVKSVRKQRIPRHALANGRWVGAVPALLQNLTYVEQMVIAVYRHSFCVAQVSLGQRFLSANVVVFGQPVARAYEALPPPRADIEQTLAILFTGPAKPTDSDVRRTPFLLRHPTVVRALEWLGCNSDTYSSIRFSPENLAEYPEDEPPVGVIYRKTGEVSAGDSSAVYQSRSELGVSEGECAFIVHSLSGEDLLDLSYDAKVAYALRYFQGGGAALAVGHDRDPQSIYHNSALFPGMFPWLYPYGLGGFENPRVLVKMDHISHVRSNLLYGDRRFQTDRCFPFIVFNQRQIRSCAQGGYLLTQRSNFDSAADKILNLDRATLDSIIDRSAAGEHVVPRTADEKACFDLIGIVDRVAGHVEGSNTSRKYMRNEIRSLIYSRGVPVFFITFAPADFKHPLCLYFCGEEIDLSVCAPKLRSSDEHLRAIAGNPVGAARFFDFLVRLFIQHILRAGTGEPGLFGETEAYYGTVESQARLTLHLHLLLWIKHTLSPQQFRDRLLSDARFEERVIDWLEDAHVGDYTASSEVQLSEELEEEYVDSRWGEPRMRTRMKRGVRDPATELPPPPPSENAPDSEWQAWEQAFAEDVDRVLFVSNRHDKHHSKGCWRGDPPYCRARFPREKFESTVVDRESGAIRFRKRSQWLNTFNYVLTHLLRCNTDVTSLLSGTQVRAVVAYVTDYVTKGKLTTEAFFDTVRVVLDKNADSLLDAGVRKAEVARSIIVKVVNAFAASAETGGPAVGAYLLGNPDHYTDQTFKPFYWHPFVRAASAAFEAPPDPLDRDREKVVLGWVPNGVIEVDKVLHYTKRPVAFEQWCLYDFIRCVDVRKFRKGERFEEDGVESAEDSADSSGAENSPRTQVEERRRAMTHRFLIGHPHRATHGAFERGMGKNYVPNFIGGVLPRHDRGDFEEYCKVMLVFFRPGGWRHGIDLKAVDERWSDSFNRTVFKREHDQVMKNLHVLYECYDARDDYTAERRAGRASGLGDFGQGGDVENDDGDAAVMDDDPHDYTEDTLSSFLDEGDIGRRTAKVRDEMLNRTHVLGGRLRPGDFRTMVAAGASCATIPRKSATYWKQLVLSAKTRVIDARKRPNGAGARTDWHADASEGNAAGVFVITKQVLDKLREKHLGGVPDSFQDPNLLLLDGVIERFTLNEEQLSAFIIACRHLHHHEEVPLRMLIAGMAGTGKSRVISALIRFLEDRKEAHRFLVLGPTGASAALIGGSTYHSVLGFFGCGEDAFSGSHSRDKVRAKLEEVDLMLIDEFSMISCLALFNIHKQMSNAFARSSLGFGGKSVIFAGDPAQLPPPGMSSALYSSKVGAWSSGLSDSAQKNAFGKALWHLFTTVVILRKNMRQTGLSDKDARFRTCLENMRLAKCTPDDVRLLMSRVCRPAAGDKEHLAPEFRDVSIITARNAHRDAINAKKTKEFARDRGKDLYRFRAIDRWGRNKESESVRKAQKAFDNVVDPVRSSDEVSARLQAALWDLPPCMSGHLAGTLDLCEGMPVLLKFNEATELCATNGAEAVVHGWVSHRKGDHVVLDTLFVRLVNPPRSVQLEGLEQNVIPLGRTKRSVKCTLPAADLTVYVSREQPMVLQNFAMTDFGSQGRTRPHNPVHLRFCKNHQSIYTCLSRSSSLDGTLILDTFDVSKITQGASPDLRREFRELEILDDITRLRLDDRLPETVRGVTRRALLNTYVQWKGARYVHDRVPGILNWASACDDELEFSESGMPPELRDNPDVGPDQSKRKNRPRGQWSKPRKKKRTNPSVQEDQGPYDGASNSRTVGSRLDNPRRLGCIWDAANYSCGYDALVTLLWNLFADRGLQWLGSVSPSNTLMEIVRARFPLVMENPAVIEDCRDLIRDLLFNAHPQTFPRLGTAGVAMSDFSRQLFISNHPFGEVANRCPCCGAMLSTVCDSNTCYAWCNGEAWWRAQFGTRSSVRAQEYAAAYIATEHPLVCGRCCSRSSASTVLTSAPPLILLESAAHGTVGADNAIRLRVRDRQRSWRLVGLVYFGGRHYTCRYMADDGTIWFHDGITTRRFCIIESAPRFRGWLATARSQPVSHLLYALQV